MQAASALKFKHLGEDPGLPEDREADSGDQSGIAYHEVLGGGLSELQWPHEVGSRRMLYHARSGFLKGSRTFEELFPQSSKALPASASLIGHVLRIDITASPAIVTKLPLDLVLSTFQMDNSHPRLL